MASQARAALYLRLSKDDSQTGLAVERQRDECLQVIEKHELDLVETYTDNGVSAYNRNVKRPAFDKMTRDYEAGKFDVVVCWDIDRFSRQPLQLETWIDLGAARGLRILTPSEATDLGTDNGRLFARMKASIARAEVERKSTRQKAQAVQAKANGTYKARVGFNDPETIKRIFAMVLDGEGVFKIAMALNKEGLTTVRGLPWSGQAVRGVAKTPRHRGSLVSESDFDDVHALVSRGERVGPKAKGLYSGVARCSTCNAAMTASGDRYVCSFATNHPGSVGHQAIMRTRMESKIDAAMIAAFLFGRDSMEPRVEDVTALDVELARVTDARQRIISLVSQDLISSDDAAPQLRDLNSKADRLEERRIAVIADNAHAQMLDGIVTEFLPRGRVNLDDAAELKLKISARWESLHDDKRRELAREFLTVSIVPRTARERVSIAHKVVTSLNDGEPVFEGDEDAA